MKKKIILWVVGVMGIVAIGIGVYAYNIYSNVQKALHEVNQQLDRSQSPKRTDEVSVAQKKPISILLAGYDQRPEDTGRSDSLMLMTLNPTAQSMKIVSIPRDTYTDIIGKGTKDKINHAFAFGGMNMSVNTVENFLNVPVDYYIAVNMEGFQAFVDAVGGVDVNNDLDFTADGTHFAKGNVHLDGKQALAYTRMRHEDPNGDFGRQMRQQSVLQAVIKKGASVSSLANYGTILTAIQRNVKTNLTQDDLFKIQENYKNSRNNVEQIQLNGEGKIMNGIWYYVVSDQTKADLSKKLRNHLSLPAQ
ncbi:LytR family transcriptional regulator [Ectobacillus sp. sgz5001026]|uniref:polyisoprenyl-teichoic acid--peptidoglycan teichoic acid transferase TagU n=1 Tax=Ectobacillus sp. sgz5001026 TaxID=3242473 RepID=UPI0036D33AC3